MDVAAEFQHAFEHTAVFVNCETDESGDPRIIAQVPFPPPPREARVPRLRVLLAIDETPALRRKAWATNPACCECGDMIESPDGGAIVPTDTGPRLAHRAVCLAVALRTYQPQLMLKGAVGRVGRGGR